MDELKRHEIFEMEVLEKLNSGKFLEPLVFGGGTMLRLCYELDRYSVDLDFWFVKKVPEKGQNLKNKKKLWEGTGDEELERFPDETPSNGETDKIAPLDGPTPPFVSDPPSAKEQLLANLAEGGKKNKKDMKAFGKFSAAIEEASGQNRSWEDIRSDLVERALGMGVFGEGPIQGNPAEGHKVKMTLREGLEAGGEIFDRPVPLSHDLPAYEKLLEESLPFIEALRQSLYPNIEEVPETERLCTGGSLDPARLAVAEFSSVIFRRYRIRERADPRGRPVLVIACDGSGSLNRYQMKMLKILACGWLNSTVRSHIQVLAGLYHSGHVRRGVSGPLVQWIYHPQKTPAISRQDAARSLISLPNDGTGVQSDALSLSFITEEARRIAKGSMIYLIVLSDTEWNRSFQTHMEGEEEVYSFFKRTYEQLPDKFHATLVALGVSGETGFENLLDKVITVASSELEDQSKVAEKIGLYVASCMRERRRPHAKG